MKAKQLIDGEYVLLETKAHASVLFRPFLKFLAWVLALVSAHGLLVRNHNYVVRHMDNSGIVFSMQQQLAEEFGPAQTLICACGAIVSTVLAGRILRWNTTRYFITNRRILLKRGLFGRIRQVAAFDLTAMRDDDFLVKRSFVQRCTGSGDIIVQTPGFFIPTVGRYVNSGYATLKNVPQAGVIAAIVREERTELVR